MPYQMIGTRRSGTNLLRVMIDQLPGFSAPQSTHELEYFTPLVPYYPDLNVDSNFMQFIDDMCRCVELNPAKWDGVVLDRYEIFNLCRERSIVAIFDAINVTAALQVKGAKDWMSKCPNYINYAESFEQYWGEDIKYIYMYRDGRDIALSFTKAVAGDKHHYFIAKEWAKTQRAAQSLKRRISPDRFFSVCYEELLQDPEEVCRRTAAFLGQPYTPDMLKFYENKSAKIAAASSSLWENIASPINTNNSKKWLAQSNESDIHIFESVAGAELEMLGYERVTDYDLSFTVEEIETFSQINNSRKEKIMKTAHPDDMKRRNAQKAHADQVRIRLGVPDHIQYDGNMIHKKTVVGNSDQSTTTTTMA
ncbi:MAG TPA: sulfotransferase [Gammaproteobacteria bacterium]|nr:sulfotransferase [Gammaproteobacteria bacterium]